MNVIDKYRYIYVSIFNGIYLIKVKTLLPNFTTMRFSIFFFLFFVCLQGSLSSICNVYKPMFFSRIWTFFVYCVISDKIIFGYKSMEVFVGFWPKYLYTPDHVFSAMLVKPKEFQNQACYFVAKQQKQQIFFFKHLKKVLNQVKKHNFFLPNVISGLKSVIAFKVTNLVMLFNNTKKDMYTIFFLRKQKFFNKGRYSRNRQLYRTGVYWCIYVNIAAVLGLNFLFYKFTINFSQYWWFFFGAILSTILPYFFKNSFYQYTQICKSFYCYLPSSDFNNSFSLSTTTSYFYLLRELFFYSAEKFNMFNY